MEKLLRKLRTERSDVSYKISKISKFRGTDEWEKLSTNHKCLLDIQLQILSSYLEVLTARIIEIRKLIDENDRNNRTTIVIDLEI